jgi:GT2 family glycosyltransferase
MVSVIICSISSAKLQRASAMYQRLLGSVGCEIIAIRDAKGLSEGYTRGLASSGGDLVICSHDDVQFFADSFAQRLLQHMQHCDLLGLAGTRRLCDAMWTAPGLPYAYGQMAVPDPATGRFEVYVWSVPFRRVDHIQGLDGVFLCGKRSVMQSVGFDPATFTGYHLYDLDFTFRAHLAGHRLSVACDLCPVHDSAGAYDELWIEDAKRFMMKHANRLAPMPQRGFRTSTVTAANLADAIEVMTPPHWAD